MDPLPQIAVLRLALATAPAPLLQPCLDFLIATVAGRHPAMLERLAEFAGKTVLIEPADAPRLLALRLAVPPKRPRLRVANARDRSIAVATIRGPLAALVALTEGRVDGDALFFSRDIAFDGDMETVVALRNALDGEEIDVMTDVIDRLGPLAGPARFMRKQADGVLRAAARDAGRLQDLLLGPALARCERMARDIDELRHEMRGRERRTARPVTAPRAPFRKAAPTES